MAELRREGVAYPELLDVADSDCGMSRTNPPLHVKSSLDPDKSSQVKSSQVKIQNGGRLSAAFGAHRWRERSGGQISAQPAPLDWITPSRARGIITIFLILIIAAHRGFNIVPFQEVYSTAMQHRSRPTMGAVGGLREGCSDGPRCR